MEGIEWLVGIFGFVAGFFSCMFLWIHVEKKKAEKENEE